MPPESERPPAGNGGPNIKQGAEATSTSVPATKRARRINAVRRMAATALDEIVSAVISR